VSWRVFGEPSDVSKDNVPATRDEVISGSMIMTTAGTSAFSCTGPSAWNSLPVFLTD